MYRDLNQVYPGGMRYLGSPRVGEVASAIPATGDHGPALAYPNVLANGWVSQRVLFWVRSHNLGSLFVSDNSAWAGTVSADGVYTVVGDVYLDGVLQSPQATVTLPVGSSVPLYAITMASLAAATAYTGFEAAYAAPGGGGGTYTATMAALSAAAAYAGFAATYTGPVVSTSTEPVTLAEAKLAARLNLAETELDPVVLGYISTARQIAEHETGRCFVRQTKRYTFSDWPAADHVMHVHSASAVAIQHWDGAAWQALAVEAFGWGEVDLGTGIAPAVGSSWPTLGAVAIGPRVRVDITAGSATPTVDAPPCVKTFICACVSWWVDNPDEGAAASLQEAPRLMRLLDPVRLWGA